MEKEPNSSKDIKAPEILHPERPITWIEARGIMGDDFLGEEVVRRTFGGKIEQYGGLKDVLGAPFPFTGAELERHKALGGLLIVRPDQIPVGGGMVPATMSNLSQAIETQFSIKGKGRVFYDNLHGKNWYRGEDFFLNEPIQAKVALVSKRAIPKSIPSNNETIDYLGKTEAMVNFLRDKAFKGISMPLEYQGAIEEFEKEQASIGRLMSSDMQEASKILPQLQLNRLTRHTASEALFDHAVYFDNTGKRLMEFDSTWTKSQTRHGHPVYVGNIYKEGFNVGRWVINGSGPGIGVYLSR